VKAVRAAFCCILVCWLAPSLQLSFFPLCLKNLTILRHPQSSGKSRVGSRSLFPSQLFYKTGILYLEPSFLRSPPEVRNYSVYPPIFFRLFSVAQLANGKPFVIIADSSNPLLIPLGARSTHFTQRIWIVRFCSF